MVFYMYLFSEQQLALFDEICQFKRQEKIAILKQIIAFCMLLLGSVGFFMITHGRVSNSMYYLYY